MEGNQVTGLRVGAAVDPTEVWAGTEEAWTVFREIVTGRVVIRVKVDQEVVLEVVVVVVVHHAASLMKNACTFLSTVWEWSLGR
jgi:hypothetical protein